MFGLHFLLTKVDLYLSMPLFHCEYLISLALIPQYYTHCLLVFQCHLCHSLYMSIKPHPFSKTFQNNLYLVFSSEHKLYLECT